VGILAGKKFFVGIEIGSYSPLPSLTTSSFYLAYLHREICLTLLLHILGECPCVATGTYNTTVTYIQNVLYCYDKMFHNPFVILVIHKFCCFNLIVSPLHCNHQYHADFDICHDFHGLIIGEHATRLSEEVLLYIVSHQARTTIRACSNKKSNCVCLRRELKEGQNKKSTPTVGRMMN
jgi:hypothetical protein